MNEAVTLLRGGGLRIRQIRLSGGGGCSAFWRQLQADVYGATRVTINTTEGAAYGAALLAAVGTGRFRNVRQACRAAISITPTIKPVPKSLRLYRKYYQQYRRLYPALRAEFPHIAALTR